MDLIFRDDECGVRTNHAPANFTTIKHMAHNLLRRPAGEDSFRLRRKVAGWDGDAKLSCAALFSFIGAAPASGWLSGCAAMDDRGFVLTDRALGEEHLDGRWDALGRRPLPFETSHPGLFAVGDVRSDSTKRVAAAVGEGSAAVRSVHDYLAFAH